MMALAKQVEESAYHGAKFARARQHWATDGL